MTNKDYAKLRKEFLDYAKENIKQNISSSEDFNGDNWFKKMKQPHNYIVGNNEFVFSVIDIDGKLYISKIF